jgi:hypothetical protein
MATRSEPRRKPACFSKFEVYNIRADNLAAIRGPGIASRCYGIIDGQRYCLSIVELVMKNWIVTALVAMLLGCTSSGSNQSPLNAEETYDGLVRVANARFQRVWVDPDADFARYKRYMSGGARFEFRDIVPQGRSGAREFPINDRQRERLRTEVGGVFEEELATSRFFSKADAAGPDVLIVEGALLDIVSQVPPQGSGRESIFLDQVGTATLVIQLRDSQTHTVLARAVERRTAGSSTGFRASSVTTWREVRRLARRWAVSLREGLDSFHQS